ncbi:acyl transferase domain-containing protein [Hirsutella rhossiliensis]|uniref:Acyl transferase domain-containing protein n=1 Tax=Hirsutella rhossiliensis TaxID=111463 RepID=A0A9P8SJU0_9HYPO|nr:acyl transferase domain-containing protein [Hirsutella rhossiliensis]KAH0965266.1 acyl transferase domain-containing protein [Hirsutella rhossiliensis]
MRDVYARAQISPNDTGYVEAYGTGTKAGDPIEAGAIHSVFGDGRTKQSPLYIGSIKTNFGHLENASGILSVIKATLILEKGFILPNVNFKKANEAIPLDAWNIKVPVDVRPWPEDKRFMSINNFGFGGSNAHVVLGHGPAVASELPQEPNRDFPQLLVISANDEGAVKRVASNVCAHAAKHPEDSQKRLLRNMAYTLGERRSHLPWRVAVATSTFTQVAKVLSGSTIAPKRAGSTPRLAFAYTGQGAQWAKMGHQLLQSHPVFADTVKAASDFLDRLRADFSLLVELSKSPEESSLGKSCISQPRCTAIQLGLTDLLSSWGVGPAMVVGHSSGEIAAAYAAGALMLEDAMAIAYHRGSLGPAEVKRMIKILGLSKITVACENSPSSVTISGDEAGIDALAVELEKQRCFHRKLRVNVAYHSSHMQVIADYLAAIKDVTPKPPRGDVSFYSALEGRRNDQASPGPTYWSKPDMIVEIGPYSALEVPIRQILKFKDQKIDYQASLVRNKDATLAMLQLAGSLFLNGADIMFDQVN